MIPNPHGLYKKPQTVFGTWLELSMGIAVIFGAVGFVALITYLGVKDLTSGTNLTWLEILAGALFIDMLVHVMPILLIYLYNEYLSECIQRARKLTPSWKTILRALL